MLGFLLFALVLVFIILSEFIAFIRTRVPFVPTTAGDIEFIVNKLGISPHKVFYDLGSGNGKVVFLVEKLTGARVTGFELSWWTILFAKLKAKLTGSKASLLTRIFLSKTGGADIIYCYLYPPLMARIEEKFKQEMQPGSIAIVRDFPFPNMPHEYKYYLPKKHEIYIYKKL